MQFICRLFRQDPNTRDGIISATSALGITVNVILAITKVILGLLTSSIAIVSEGANVAADSLSSLITLLGTKLAQKHPDEKHPFGYGRIEYLVSLIIAVLILVTGVEMLTSSVKLIFHPEEMNISYLAIAIVLGSAIVKFCLGTFTMHMGKKADSNALVGVGLDSRGDAYASLVTIASSLFFLLFGINLDAYAGIFISLLILKAGWEVLSPTIADLLGRPGEAELAKELYQEIRSTPGILSAVDMMLHNYGPDAWSGSVNVEIDHEKTVGELYAVLHDLQLRIMHKYKVVLVFGVYAVDNDHEEVRALRKDIAKFVRQEEGVESFHAVYLDNAGKTFYVDFIVDYTLKDWEALRSRFLEYIAPILPGYHVELTIETQFV